MINMSLNRLASGYATLATSVVLLVTMTLATFFTAKAVEIEHRIETNSYRAEQAFSAGQAGLSYATTYAQNNYNTLTDNQVITGTLSNGAGFSAKFIFQGGSKDFLKIQSTGTSADGDVTRVVSQLIKYHVSSGALSTVPLLNRGQVKMAGNTFVRNLQSANTVITGDNKIKISGNAKTILSSGTGSNSSNIGSDVDQNNTSVANKTNAQLQNEYLGNTITNKITQDVNAMLPAATIYNSNKTFSGNGSVGSPANPVNIVVYGKVTVNGNKEIYGNIYASKGVTINGNGTVYGNVISNGSGNKNKINGNGKIYGYVIANGNIKIDGNGKVYGNATGSGTLNFSGNAEVHGLVFSLGKLKLRGNTKIFGAAVSGGSYDASGNAELNYDSNNIQGVVSSNGNYGRVPGSWQDLGV